MKRFLKIIAIFLLATICVGVGAFFGDNGSKVSPLEDCCEYRTLHQQLEKELAEKEQALFVLESHVDVLSDLVNSFVAGGGDSAVMFEHALQQIRSMFIQIGDLESQLSILTGTNTTQSQQITEQLETIRQLNIQVSNLTQLLFAWESYNRFVVVFMVEGLAFNTQILDPEFDTHARNPGAPDRGDEWIFDGWSVDGVNVINVSNYVIRDSVTFKAVWTWNVSTVTFISNGTVVQSGPVVNGRFAMEPELPQRANYNYGGWILNGSAVNVGTTIITGNTTFTALWTAKTWQVVYGTFVPVGVDISSNDWSNAARPTSQTGNITNGYIFQFNISTITGQQVPLSAGHVRVVMINSVILTGRLHSREILEASGRFNVVDLAGPQVMHSINYSYSNGIITLARQQSSISPRILSIEFFQ
jgi:hypothetical protein